MSDQFFNDEEYLKRAQIRKERVEAAKKKQALMKKYFFIGALALFVIIILIIVLVIINVNKKHRDNSKVNDSNANEVIEINSDDNSDDGIIDNNNADAETDNENISDNATSGEDDAPQIALGDDYSALADELYKNRKYTLAPSDITYDSSSAVYMSSDEYLSERGILIDLSTSKVIATKDGTSRMYPASMTKVLTVLTAWQYISDEELSDTVMVTIEATDYSFLNGCSSVGFEPGEIVTVKDLFYGTILSSGADAAYTLAQYVAGSQEAFVYLMNKNIEDLGLSDTSHFTNCVGIYNDNHYTTCLDMAKILEATMQYDFLKEVMGARKYLTSETEYHPEGIEISNWFLRRIEDKSTGGYVAGAKTGFVNESGSCGASYMQGDNGINYICVSGNAWSSWRCIYDHVAAYNIYAIGNTSYRK